MARPVGGVQVHRDLRVVVVHQLHERARLGGLQLHVVPVEIEVLRVGALPLSRHRAILPAAVGQAHLLVAVGVVDRLDDEDHGLQPVGVLAFGELAKEDQRRFLALDLAGVDVPLDVDAQPVGALHRRGGGVGGADDRQRHGPAFECLPEVGEVNQLRRLLRRRLHERHDVVVAAGLGEGGPLRARLERVSGRGLRRGDSRNGGEQHGEGDRLSHASTPRQVNTNE